MLSQRYYHITPQLFVKWRQIQWPVRIHSSVKLPQCFPLFHQLEINNTNGALSFIVVVLPSWKGLTHGLMVTSIETKGLNLYQENSV